MSPKFFASLAALSLASITSPVAQDGPGPSEPAYLYRATVERVVDSDTIDVDIDLGFYTWLKSQRIRMVGIDAPEPKGETRSEGLESTAFLKDLIEGKEIIIRTFKAKDGGDEKGKWGRWLGRIYLNGLDLNQHMIDTGHAVVYEEEN